MKPQNKLLEMVITILGVIASIGLILQVIMVFKNK